MTGTLRISEAASLALHAMALLATRAGEVVSVPEVAGALGVSEAHLAKVLQRLNHAGLVESVRGPRGGFRLAERGRNVSLLKVYESVEGPLPSGQCLLGKPACKLSRCVLGELLKNVNREVREYLSNTKLAELAGAYRNGQAKHRQD